MPIQKVIEQFGYTPNEAKVYLAALSLGECNISDISAKIKMPRTSAQIIINKLHKDGLMNFYIKRRYRYWTAENPEKLLIRLREKEAALRAVMPELAALRRNTGEKPRIKVFTGADEIKLILEDIVAAKHHILGIVAWDKWIELFGRDYLDDFIESRRKHFLKIRLLAPKTPLSIRLREKDAKELRETRFWPEDIHIENSNFIYANKIAIISLSKKQPTGVIIEDADVQSMMSVFFELLWNQSA